MISDNGQGSMAALAVSASRSPLAADLRLGQCDTIDHPITPLLAYVCCESLTAEDPQFYGRRILFCQKVRPIPKDSECRVPLSSLSVPSPDLSS